MIQDKDYLALTLVGEARGEPIESIVGVGFTIQNRAYSLQRSYRTIVLAKSQFSCWNEKDRNFPLLSQIMEQIEADKVLTDPYIRQCFAIANLIYINDLVDNVKGAKNYVTTKRYQLAKARQDLKEDGWIIKMKPTVTLGNHTFLVD